MGMVVQCNSCMTEYRLNEALLKGAKGACIRCPKCRERIFVENPQAAPAAPSITQRVTPPVVTPPITPRVKPPAVRHRSPNGFHLRSVPRFRRVQNRRWRPVPCRGSHPRPCARSHRRLRTRRSFPRPPRSHRRWRPVPCRGSRPRPCPRRCPVSHRRSPSKRALPRFAWRRQGE